MTCLQKQTVNLIKIKVCFFFFLAPGFGDAGVTVDRLDQAAWHRAGHEGRHSSRHHDTDAPVSPGLATGDLLIHDDN